MQIYSPHRGKTYYRDAACLYCKTDPANKQRLSDIMTYRANIDYEFQFIYCSRNFLTVMSPSLLDQIYSPIKGPLLLRYCCQVYTGKRQDWLFASMEIIVRQGWQPKKIMLLTYPAPSSRALLLCVVFTYIMSSIHKM